MDLVVVSTPRSATRYMARTLTASGLRCGHEESFRFTDYWTNAEFKREEARDSSWLAAAFLDRLSPDTTILYQIREPWKTMNSIFTQNTNDEKFLADGQWVNNIVGPLPEKLEERVEQFWIRWHRLIRANLSWFNRVFTYRTEDINEELLLEVGAPSPDLSNTTKENTRGDTLQIWSEDSLPSEIDGIWKRERIGARIRRDAGAESGNRPLVLAHRMHQDA